MRRILALLLVLSLVLTLTACDKKDDDFSLADKAMWLDDIIDLKA